MSSEKKEHVIFFLQISSTKISLVKKKNTYFLTANLKDYINISTL